MNDQLDKLEGYLATYHYIRYQDGLWHLFDRYGEGVAQGVSLRGMVCHLPEWPDLEKATSDLAESLIQVGNLDYFEKNLVARGEEALAFIHTHWDCLSPGTFLTAGERLHYADMAAEPSEQWEVYTVIIAENIVRRIKITGHQDHRT